MCDVGMFNEDGMFFKNLRIDRKLHEVDIDVFKKTVDDTAHYKPLFSINSTEPLMYKPLGEAISYCTQKGIETAVTTGAYTLPERAEELAKAGLTRLNVSIDGAPGVHNFIRGRKDSFEKSELGVKRFREECEKIGHNAEIFLNCCINNLNYSDIQSFYESVRDWPVDQINFSFVWFIDPATAQQQNSLYAEDYGVSDSCYGDDMDPSKVDVALLAEQINNLKDRPKVFFSPAFSERQLKRYFHAPDKFMTDGAKCMASWFFMQVLADGNVIVYTRCHSKPVGNINDEPILDIWNGGKMKEWRRFIKRVKTMPMCKRCDLAY